MTKAKTSRKVKAEPASPTDGMPVLATVPEVGAGGAIAGEAATTEAVLDIDLIDPDPANVRTLRADVLADAGLRASISVVGILEPPMVRAHPESVGRFMVVMGHRRVAAARALGVKRVRCRLLAEDGKPERVAALQAAENMVRAPMHPVDRWTALARMTDEGMDEATACAALGMSRRDGALLQRLGKLAPTVLSTLRQVPASEIVGLSRSLNVIWSVPVDTQGAALAKLSKGVTATPDGAIRGLASALHRPVLTGGLAIFRIVDSGLAWTEDLFMPADDPHRFTTTDIKGFLREQAAALDLSVKAESEAGHPILLTTFDEGAGDPVMPAGWMRTWRNADDRLPKGSKATVLTWVKTAGYQMGMVCRMVAEPKASAVASGSSAKAQKAERGPITHNGLNQIADAQETAIQVALGDVVDPARMLAALVIAIGADNLIVQGSPHNYEPDARGWGRGNRFRDLATVMAASDRTADPDAYRDLALAQARAAIARLVVAPAPKRSNSSGRVTLHLGHVLDASRHLPRFDTMDFLKEVGGEMLGGLCDLYRQKRGKNGAMRSALGGRMELWAPTEAAFRGPNDEELTDAAAEPEDGDDSEAAPVFGDPEDEGDAS